ncbi:MAG: S8 family serine peptidase, partial [Acidimicrobiia bacterium]|nr:S8 family serine peptidase [Acidimicrobiia bacterium]
NVSVAVLGVAALLAVGTAPIVAQESPEGAPPFAADKADLLGAAPVLAKVDSQLVAALGRRDAGASVAQVQAELPDVRFAGTDVQLDLVMDHVDDTVVASLTARGLIVDGVYPEYARISGRAPLEAIPPLADVPEVDVVQRELGYVTNVGATTSQADATVKADVARTTAGVDGSGLEIGVISDSFNSARGGATSGSGCGRVVTGMTNQNSGDLPPTVGLLDDGPPATDEGAGMGELVHDLAPGAGITFHTAAGGEAGFAAGINELRTCGADIIVDDIIYLAEPMFQDGPVAQAAQATVDAGVPYFSSAGNQGTTGIDDRYLAGPNGLHDFGGGDQFAEVVLAPGQGVTFIMQWNEPFDGALGPGARNDFDLFVVDAPSPTANVLTSSVSAQGCAVGPSPQGNPLEGAGLTNISGSPLTVYLAVQQFCQGAPAGVGEHLRVATFPGGSPTFEGDIFTDAQIYGHAAAAGAVAVGAIDFCEADTNGTFTPPSNVVDVERFTSLGGAIPLYFDSTGAPLRRSLQTRIKPEITAPDGTNTTFFAPGQGHSTGCGENDGFPNFFGTSAAAPHAAAVAALMLEATPNLTPAAVTATLQNTARDIGAPGFDFRSGAGLIDALAAVTAGPVQMCEGRVVTVDLSKGESPTNGPDVVRGTTGADVINALGGDDIICGLGGNDIIRGGVGDDQLFGQAGNDELFGGAGNDVTSGGSGADFLAGQAGDDELLGGAGDDRGFAGIGADVVRGEKGDDRLRGGPGDDDLSGGDGVDVAAGNAGDDRATGGGGPDRLNGGIDDDSLIGGGGDDQLRGFPGDDVLSGGAGFDRLFGGGDRDRCNGEVEIGCEI